MVVLKEGKLSPGGSDRAARHGASLSCQAWGDGIQVGFVGLHRTQV